MKVSTRGRYGLAAMVELALLPKDEVLSLSAISERQDVSIGYLEQIFSLLRKAGLVKSSKGPQGGYSLADSPDKITVGSVLRVLEDGLCSSGGEHEDLDAKADAMAYCLEVNVWHRIDASIQRVIDEITLASLARELQKLRRGRAPMFYI